MRLKECETLEDIVKHLQWRGNKSGWYLLEVERVQNKLLCTYGKPHEEKEAPEIAGHKLIMSTKVKQDKEKPMQFRRCVLDLCNHIEPYRSKKEYYDHMRRTATEESKENLEIT